MNSLVQLTMDAVVRLLGMRLWFEGGVLISDAARVFDTDGRVADAATPQRIRTFVQGFGVFARVRHRQYERRLSAAPIPKENLQLHDLMDSGHRQPVVPTIETKEAR